MADDTPRHGGPPPATLNSFVPRPPLRLVSIPGRRRGTAKFFLAAKGYGFIVDERSDQLSGQDILVHHTELYMGDDRIPSLGRGEPVEYNLNFADRKGCVGLAVGPANTAPLFRAQGQRPRRRASPRRPDIVRPPVDPYDHRVLTPFDSAAFVALANRMPPASPFANPSPFPNPFEAQFQRPAQLLPTRPSGDNLHLTIDMSNADAIEAVIEKLQYIRTVQQTQSFGSLGNAFAFNPAVPTSMPAPPPQVGPKTSSPVQTGLLPGRHSAYGTPRNDGHSPRSAPPGDSLGPYTPFGPNSPHFDAIEHVDTSFGTSNSPGLTPDTSGSGDAPSLSPNSSFHSGGSRRSSGQLRSAKSPVAGEWSPYDDGEEPRFSSAQQAHLRLQEAVTPNAAASTISRRPTPLSPYDATPTATRVAPVAPAAYAAEGLQPPRNPGGQARTSRRQPSTPGSVADAADWSPRASTAVAQSPWPTRQQLSSSAPAL